MDVALVNGFNEVVLKEFFEPSGRIGYFIVV